MPAWFCYPLTKLITVTIHSFEVLTEEHSTVCASLFRVLRVGERIREKKVSISLHFPSSIMPDERKKTHAPKVCSVLLPLYAASDYQSLDQFKGYDKVTKSPDHLTLPKWNIPHDKVQKYRAGATTNPAHA